MADQRVSAFRIEVPQGDLDDLADRLARARWPEPATAEGWAQGIPLDYLHALVEHWRTAYDWRAREAAFNQLPQVRVEVDGVAIHAFHVPSAVPGALPLVLTHGWPGSFVEFMQLVGPLTDPVAHGGDAADAFTVVIPSLPGYGWSGKPTTTGWGVEKIADAWAELMGVLGYERFGAQGGDWGATVTSALGARHPDRVVGIHMNMVVAFPGPDDGDPTEEELDGFAAFQHYQEHESGYSTEQRTRPQTIGYSLVDSPVGLAAWVVEKFAAWSDTDWDPVRAIGADRLLDNVMVYWLTRSGASSARLYWESFASPPTAPVDVPMGAAVFPKELFRASQRWAAHQYHDIRRWERMPRGGHFAALEQPELLLGEIREFFRPLR